VNGDVRDALARLSPEQRAQLTEQLRTRRNQSPTDGIAHRPDPQQYPLSEAQHRLWRLHRLRPDTPIYNLQVARELRGPLDAVALRQGLAQVERRHATLRANFIERAGAVRQVVADPGRLVLQQIDVSDQPDPMQAALRVAQQDAERPFDLEVDPLFRATLLRVDNAQHILLLTLHHIVADGWSVGIIEEELSETYRACREHRPAALPDLPLEYADIAYWQRGRGSEALQAEVEYWTRQLSGTVAPLELPGAGTAAGPRSMAGGHHTFRIPAPLTAAVHDRSRRSRVTPFTLLMAAFQILLHRCSGQDDVVVCTPVAGRSRRETERLVGYFNNLVVLRGDLRGDPTCATVLERLRPVVAGAFDHQELPFQTVAGLPHLSTTPLTRALFVLQDTGVGTLDLPDVATTPLTVAASTSDFDLGVFVRPDKDALSGVIRYRTHSFSPDMLPVLVDDFLRVLRSVVETPDARASQLARPAVADMAATGEKSTQPGVQGQKGQPRSALESALRDIWERLFRVRPIGVHDDFFELGGHSLLAAELAAEVEQRITGQPLPLASLFSAPTISQLAELIDSGGWSWASLVPIKPTGTRPPLYFVHAHGGNVIGYRDLARHLDADQPFYGLQAPDIRAADAVAEPRSLREIAARYVEEVRSLQATGPYFVGGWCLGGDIAYEMACQLTAAGLDVPLVLLVDNPRPSHVATGRDGRVAARVRTRLLNRAVMEWDNLRELPAGARPAHVGSRLGNVAVRLLVGAERWVASALRGAPVSLPTSRTLRRERIAERHEKAYQEYEPSAYTGQVALFRAERQPLGRAQDPTLGWSPYVAGTLDVHDLPGHRIGLLSEPRVATAAELMVQAMDAAVRAEAPPG